MNQVKLIIEAGSSKTDYAILVGDSLIHQAQGAGLNPATDPGFNLALQTLMTDIGEICQHIDKVSYYGAGCVNATINQHVHQTLLRCDPGLTEITIHDDMLAACRSVSDGLPGLVCILGTGSNICYFDGLSIRDRVRSSGYLLGDEGSGYRLGQAVYLRFVRGLLSQETSEMIRERFKLPLTDPVLYLYEHNNPRTFLAGLAAVLPLLDQTIQDDILAEVFNPLFDNMVLPLYTTYQVPVTFVGSIGHHFMSYLDNEMRQRRIAAAGYVKSPIGGLIKYHLDKN